jgi:hypothetical protein
MEPIRKKQTESEWCQCCSVQYTSEKNKQAHLAGRRHLHLSRAHEKVVELAEPIEGELVLNKSNDTFELNFKALPSKACDIYDKFDIKVYESQAGLVSAKAMAEINEMKLNLFEMLDERLKESIAKIDSGFDQFHLT